MNNDKNDKNATKEKLDSKESNAKGSDKQPMELPRRRPPTAEEIAFQKEKERKEMERAKLEKERLKMEEEEREKERALKFARQNTESTISDAKARFLARKAQKEKEEQQ